jgi:hypothetical protein
MRRVLLLWLLFTLATSPGYPQSQVSGQATVVVTPAMPITISFSPTSATLSSNQTQNFIVTLTNDTANLGANLTLSGPGCTGASCGSVSPAFARTGQTVVYTAPTTAPSPNSVTLTATSIQDSTKFINAVITLSGSPPPPTSVNNVCSPNFQTSAATNTFSCAASQGTAVVVALIGSPSITVSGVQACTPLNVCSNLTQACTPSAVCFSNVGGGFSTHFYGLNLPTGITTYKVSNSAFGQDIQAIIYDISNVTAFDTAASGGSGTASTNPSLPITTHAPGLIVTTDTTLNVTAIASPFTFVSAPSNIVGASAYAITNAAGTYNPTWTQQSAGYALFSSAFIGGPPSTAVAVSTTPPTASVAVNGTQQFTATVVNSTQGVTWALSGSGCSGATCGGLSASSSASGVAITYTAPASVPSPATVTLTATSVTDPTKSASSTITVTAAPVVGVTVSPTTANVVANGTQTITATVTNSTSGVTWTLTGSGCTGTACGSISATSSASGTAITYTAPGTVPSPATVTLKATSVSDSTKSASATFTITAPVISVSVAPTTATVASGGATQQFTATVTNSTQGVGWILSGSNCSGSGCGTLSSSTSASKVAITYTSPTTASALTMTLTATSTQNTGVSASATINVTVSSSGSFSCVDPNCPAFPEAQGGGAATVGGSGRQGTGTPQVFLVTNNNDGGTGSLRACVAASGPRTCVFRVAGLFPITAGDLRFSSPYLTVACQSAPGEVILGGPTTTGALFGISTHDVIMRYCTLSPDNPNIITGPDTGTTSIWIVNCGGVVTPSTLNLSQGGCYNIMIDHVTTRWSGNKSWITTSNFTPYCGFGGSTCPTVSIVNPVNPSGKPLTDPCTANSQPTCNGGVGPNHNITTQWSTMYEPQQGHPVGYGTATDESCTGTIASAGYPWCLSLYEQNIDFHHNLLVNISHRIPENSNQSTRWINNIIYNWDYYANEWLGGETIDAINNKYITGQLNAEGAQTAPIHFTEADYVEELTGAPSVYVSGNITGPPGTNTVQANQYATSMVQMITGENGNEEGAIPTSWIRNSPMPASNNWPIAITPATSLDSVLLPIVGNSQHLDCLGNWVNHQDAQDARIISQYQNGGSGGFWPNAVTYDGVYYLYNATYAPQLPKTCPSGQTCLPFPNLQSPWTDNPVTGFPVCTESQNDGIPDAWKTQYGLSTTNPNLWSMIDQAVGYTFLEVYLDHLKP